MAEGLEEAANAFAQEISPGSERPRDESGRFSSTSPRPEPLFEPRDLEGDEKTGDTRDAGDDPRLAARERSIADGWHDEGNDGENQSRSRKAPAQTEREGGERRLQPDGEERDNAAADDGHPGAEDEPAGDKDEKPDAEADDAEAARWALTHDGKPVEKIEIDVGGETRQVSLQEVVKGYAEQEAINQRAAKVEEIARTFEQQSTAVAQEIGQARQTYQQRLEYIGRVMADLYPKELNWREEYARDPKAAEKKEEVYQHVRGRMTLIYQEMQREQAEAQAQYQAQQQVEAQQVAAYAEWGKKEFMRRTKIPQDTINNEYARMRKAALEIYGFVEHEVGSIFDPRMMAVLYDATNYRNLTANKPRPVMPDQGRALAPGAARPNSGGTARRRIDDALKTQQRTGGSIDATAAVFERLIR